MKFTSVAESGLPAVALTRPLTACCQATVTPATTGSPLSATLVNFTVGTMLLLVVAGIVVAARGLPGPLPGEPLLYVGGLLGILFIAAAAVIVPLTGVLLLALGTVAGQLAGALLLDLFVPADGDHLTVATVAGTALTLVAVAVAALPARRRV